jgi:lysophospholipase
VSADARLIGTPEAPVPPGGAAAWYEGDGGVSLRAAFWRPPGEARGSVVLSPGRTEPIEKYFEVIGEFLARGFAVLAHDWRGQGLSHRMLPDRRRGHAEDWRHFVADHKRLMEAFGPRLPAPVYAVGHSMGACFVALALPDETRMAGAILSSPMFGVALGPLPPRFARTIARGLCGMGWAGAHVPRGAYDPVVAPFDPGNILTHDRARFERHRAQLQACPDLALGGVTWGWLDQAFGAMTAALDPSLARAIRVPVLVLTAAEERLVVNAATAAFAANLPNGRLVEVTGARHEILMETNAVRATFWREFDAFVDERDASPAGRHIDDI